MLLYCLKYLTKTENKDGKRESNVLIKLQFVVVKNQDL